MRPFHRLRELPRGELTSLVSDPGGRRVSLQQGLANLGASSFVEGKIAVRVRFRGKASVSVSREQELNDAEVSAHRCSVKTVRPERAGLHPQARPQVVEQDPAHLLSSVLASVQ